MKKIQTSSLTNYQLIITLVFCFKIEIEEVLEWHGEMLQYLATKKYLIIH